MSRIYDNWERLVYATLRKEQDRQLALCESFSSSASDFSFASLRDDVAEVPGISSNIEDSEPDDRFYIERSFENLLTETKISNFPDVQFIAFKELQKATRNFRVNWIIGKGKFVYVYKGYIDEHTLTAAKPGAGIAVAVKQWNPDSCLGRREWLTEIHYLRHRHHPNLVKLIGYCFEQNDLLLVYEFMPKGSLRNHLYRSWNQALPWATRIKVAIGAARGLSFLHDSEREVIHRQINTSNILLDGDFNAKFAAFGFATHCQDGGNTDVSTKTVISPGYASSLCLLTGQLTQRCDVHDFGVVLLELLSGLRVTDKNRPRQQQNLVEWARPFLGDERELFQIMDPRLEAQYHKKQTYAAAVLASRCLRLSPEERPSMTEVLAALEALQRS